MASLNYNVPKEDQSCGNCYYAEMDALAMGDGPLTCHHSFAREPRPSGRGGMAFRTILLSDVAPERFDGGAAST